MEKQKLINLIKNILEEQYQNISKDIETHKKTTQKQIPSNLGFDTKGMNPLTTYDNKYNCVQHSYKLFVDLILTNMEKYSKYLNLDKNIIILLLKATLGIIKRESKYGNYVEIPDVGAQFLIKIGLGSIVDKVSKIRNSSPSLGPSQITKEFWFSNNLDKIIGPYEDAFKTTESAFGVLITLANKYKKAIQNKISTMPSTNDTLQKYGVIKYINGTNNHALDMAILSHNFGEEKTIYPYCRTSHPLFFALCHKDTEKLFNTEESFNNYKKNSSLYKILSQNPKNSSLLTNPGTIKIDNTKPVYNYMPNLSAGLNLHTSIGYVEYVANEIKNLKCITL